MSTKTATEANRDWAREAKEQGTAVARQVSDLLNGYGSEREQAFIEAMKYEHRTLQQSFTGLCLRWLKDLSERQEHEYDLRNEHSVKVAKMIRARLEEEWGPAWFRTPLI